MRIGPDFRDLKKRTKEMSGCHQADGEDECGKDTRKRKKGIELIVRYRGPGGACGFFFWTRGTLVTGLGVEVCCGPVRVMIGGAVGVGGGLVLVSVEGGFVSGDGGLVVPGGLVPGGLRTGGGVTVGYGLGPRCGGLMTG
jgi:hypothetical protein